MSDVAYTILEATEPGKKQTQQQVTDGLHLSSVAQLFPKFVLAQCNEIDPR